ncbi:hypothetical protein [Fluviicola taffensis]|uniref:hypothetical protein n=1 Tax=Fluviicola taffensis TaxID=191579 RepID=UPI003137FEAB
MKHILLFPLLFSILPAFSQQNIFKWGEGLTYYTGKFDPKKFNEKELDTIYNYLYNCHFEMMTVGNIWKIEQMDTATTKSIDLYYTKTLHILETMRIPPGLFWDSLRIYRKKELFEVCQHNRLYILALKDPSVMYDYYHDECSQEIKALNGDSTQLLQAWFELKEKQKLTNCCPENLEKRYQAEYSSKNRLKYARYELMTYGWGNCMNQFVYYHSDDQRIQPEFEKLFLHVDREDEKE